MEQWREDVLIHYGVKGMKWRHRKNLRNVVDATNNARRINKNLRPYIESNGNGPMWWNMSNDLIERYSKKDPEHYVNYINARFGGALKRSRYLKGQLSDASKKASLMGRSYESNARREKELEKNAKKKLEQTARSYESTARRKQALEKQKSSKRDKVKNTINKILSRVKR